MREQPWAFIERRVQAVLKHVVHPTAEVVWRSLSNRQQALVTADQIGERYPELLKQTPGPPLNKEGFQGSKLAQARAEKRERKATQQLARGRAWVAARRREQLEEAKRARKVAPRANVVWKDLKTRVPIDKAAAMELAYTSTTEPHYEPYKD